MTWCETSFCWRQWTVTGQASLGLEYSTPNRWFGSALRLRARTDARVSWISLNLELIGGVGFARGPDVAELAAGYDAWAQRTRAAAAPDPGPDRADAPVDLSFLASAAPAHWECGGLDGGEDALAEGRPGDAVAQLMAAVRLDPGCGKIRLRLGRALIGAGDAAGAVTVLENLSEVYESPGVFAWLARARLGTGDAAGAVAAAENARRLRPDLAEIQRIALDARLAAGDTAGARALFDAVSATSRLPVWVCYRAILLAAEGDLESATQLTGACDAADDPDARAALEARLIAR